MITSSFIQENKHATKSNKFVHIKPAQIGEVLLKYGFELAHLKTGKARKLENESHQTTIARYRSTKAFEVDGQTFDLIFKVPHLTGAIQATLGLFRGLCANQLNVGKHFFSTKVKHLGDAISQLDSLIPALLSQQSKLVDQVKLMQATNLNTFQCIMLANKIVDARFQGVNNNIVDVSVLELLNPRRDADVKTDLYTIMNVIQENIMRYGLRYQTQNVNADGSMVTRNLRSRPIKPESEKAIELNGAIWDAAMSMVKAS